MYVLVFSSASGLDKLMVQLDWTATAFKNQRDNFGTP